MSMEITKEEAKKLYENQPSWFKEKLEKAFDKETFRKINFKDLKTFDDLCKVCGTTEAEYEAKWKDLPVSQTIKTIGKMEILSGGINQGWMPDTLDTTQRKWFPIFTVSSSGLVFSDSYYYGDGATAIVGFPFCFETEEKSNHAGKQFIKLWEELILRKTN